MHDCKARRRPLAGRAAPRCRTPLVAAALLAGALLAAPAGAATRPSPSIVAWHVLTLANATLRASGTPRAQLVQTIVCARRAYPRYSCRGTFGDGSQITWRHVTLTDAGALAVGGNSTG